MWKGKRVQRRYAFLRPLSSESNMVTKINGHSGCLAGNGEYGPVFFVSTTCDRSQPRLLLFLSHRQSGSNPEKRVLSGLATARPEPGNSARVLRHPALFQEFRHYVDLYASH